jgi:hypothetical protein
MQDPTVQKWLAAAQQRVRDASVLLARPRTCDLDECAALLQEAQGNLEQLRDSLCGGVATGREWRQEALALGRDIRRAGALLEQAARFGRAWLARLRAASAGYTAAGSPTPVQPCGRILVRG